MSDIATLKSYLVDLGFRVDQPSLGQFTNVIKNTTSLIEGSTVRIAGNIVKWQAAVVGMFTAVSGAVIGTMDKVAMADQEYRLFGERMFMDAAHAKTLTIALDALGQPLEAIAFDPELHERFVQLQKDQQQLTAGLGAGFEGTMRGLRDIRFEFTRFQVTLEYLTQGVVSEIFKQLGLGSGDVLSALHQLNDYIIQHVPQWSKQFAAYVVPILKDTWHITKDLVELFGLLANHFTNFIGVLTGDNSIQGATFSFDKFARAIEKCVAAVAWLLDKLLKIEKVLVPFSGAIGGALGGAGMGAAIGAVGGPIGAGGGAVIGGGIGLIVDLITNMHSNGANGKGSDIPSQARALAQSLSGQLNIPADILYAQWAHETANFTNRGSQQLNNLAGIRIPGSTEYKAFGSLQEFGNYYASTIRNNYAGAMGAQNIDQFATALKHGRGGRQYMEAPLAEYERGMQRFSPTSGGVGPQDNSVTIGDIHITQPNASAEEISNVIMRRIDERQFKQTQRNLAEMTSVYG